MSREMDKLVHDIERYIAIAGSLATENERLRLRLKKLKAKIANDVKSVIAVDGLAGMSELGDDGR